MLNYWYRHINIICLTFDPLVCVCVRAKLSKITVHLGEYDTKDGEEEPLDSQTYKVDHISIHPDFR